MSYILCPTVQGGREVTRERRTNNQQQPTHTTISSFSATIYRTNIICTGPYLTYSLHSFSQQQCPFHPHSLSKIYPATHCPPQFTHHLTAPADIFKFPTTHQKISHILHYSAITNYTPLIANYSTLVFFYNQLKRTSA